MRHLFLLLLLFCGITTAASEAAVVSYTDKLGRAVEIPLPVQRVVFFQLYEMLPALDVWERVAGVSSYVYRDDLIRAAKPDIEKIPSVGTGSDVNVEAVMQLKPDLVLTWAWKAETIRFMEEKGLKVIAVYPESIGELYEIMRLLGRLFEREDLVKTTIAEMETTFALIRERAGKRLDKEQRTMLFLGGRSNSVSCALGINNDLMTMIGGINLAGTIQERNTLVSLEQIVVWNPEIIFIWANAGYTAKDILENPQWRNIRAVREGRVYKTPNWTSWSPRLTMLALWMAKQAYPEDFKDIELAAMADRLYRKVFHIPYKPAAQP